NAALTIAHFNVAIPFKAKTHFFFNKSISKQRLQKSILSQSKYLTNKSKDNYHVHVILIYS
ncbi:hypothetical protein, partial [Borreliella garinii]|uniref:hypothetical protein n=1 Tax=Borreliella garinii TaxID=29519 RepID=UPI001AEDC442